MIFTKFKSLSLHLCFLALILLILSACMAQKPIQQVEPHNPDVIPKGSDVSSTPLTLPALPSVEAPRHEHPLPQQAPLQPEALINPQPEAPQPELPLPKRTENKSARNVSSQQKDISNRLTLSQLIKKYPRLLLLKGSSAFPKIALTFDDAPDTRYTPQVLDVLKKHHVKATFFVVGSRAEKHSNIVKRITGEGHAIGNHSYNHSLFTKLTDDQFISQINKTQKAIKSVTGYAPMLIRPPYGEITETQLLWASTHHFHVINWNVDSLDWKQLSEQQVVNNILSHTKAGSIILQHSGGGPNQNLSGTVAALPVIIESLQSRGYRFVTIPDLLKISAKQQ